jgi:hypothetical protein
VESRPDLLQRVVQHQLASYLEIKPLLLSRNRKKMMNELNWFSIVGKSFIRIQSNLP